MEMTATEGLLGAEPLSQPPSVPGRGLRDLFPRGAGQEKPVCSTSSGPWLGHLSCIISPTNHRELH